MIDTLWSFNIAIENHHVQWENMGKFTISMAIFNKYVKLPEGNVKSHPASNQKTLDFLVDQLKDESGDEVTTFFLRSPLLFGND